METKPWNSREAAARGTARMKHQDSRETRILEGETPADEPVVSASDRRFYVVAPSVNAVRKALFRAPGGARVVGRHDRRTIACVHTMDGRSLARHWPVLVSRLDKAGLRVETSPRMVDDSDVIEDPEAFP
jgi:hypothetical protein